MQKRREPNEAPLRRRSEMSNAEEPNGAATQSAIAVVVTEGGKVERQVGAIINRSPERRDASRAFAVSRPISHRSHHARPSLPHDFARTYTKRIRRFRLIWLRFSLFLSLPSSSSFSLPLLATSRHSSFRFNRLFYLSLSLFIYIFLSLSRTPTVFIYLLSVSLRRSLLLIVCLFLAQVHHHCRSFPRSLSRPPAVDHAAVEEAVACTRVHWSRANGL